MGRLSTISVIVPTRDRPAMLESALESVFAQHLPPSEVLVVDDGSRRDAGGLVRRLTRRAGVPVRVLEGPRSGPGAARNVGLRAARGWLIAFLDDDDLWLPDKLARQAEWFQRRAALGLVGTRTVRSDGRAGTPPHRRAPRPRMRLVSRSALVRANRLSMSSVVARRECFEQCGGFDESLPLAQDWDMWLRISAAWQIGIVALPLTVYRLHDGQRSANRLAMRKWEAEVVERALRRGDLRGRRARGAARRRLAWAHFRFGRCLRRAGDTRGAVAELRESLNLFPYNPLVWSSLLRRAFDRRAAAGAGS